MTIVVVTVVVVRLFVSVAQGRQEPSSRLPHLCLASENDIRKFSSLKESFSQYFFFAFFDYYTLL
jgi:hypothetical protein